MANLSTMETGHLQSWQGRRALSDPRHYYEVLEVPVFATPEVVKAAYRKLARQHHPDLNQQNRAQSEERLKHINEAYEVLKDVARRQIYDDYLRQKLAPPPPVPSVKHSPPPVPSATKVAKPPPSQAKPAGVPITPVGKPAGKSTSSVEDGKRPFGWLFDSWKAPAQSATNIPGSSTANPSLPPMSAGKTSAACAPPHPAKSAASGQAVETGILLTAHEAQTGCVKSIPLTVKTGCPECAATGRTHGHLCPTCSGERIVTLHRVVEVKIPAGVKAGAKIRVAGEGAPSAETHGPAGDLILTVQLPSTPQLQVRGLNAYLDWAIVLPLAVLGGEVQVPTVHGEVSLWIPAGSHRGQVLRLKEQGVHQGAMKGDQFVTLDIAMPSTLSPKQRKLYEQLLKLEAD